MQSILVVSALVIHDPICLFFRTVPDGQLPSTAQQRFQNAAIAKNFGRRYNAVIIGTSLSENFSTDEMRRKLGVDTMNLSISGAEFNEMLTVLNYTLSRNPQVKTVFWGLLPRHVFASEHHAELPDTFPAFLYNDSDLDDLKAYFSKRFLLTPQTKDENDIWSWYSYYKSNGFFSRKCYFDSACLLMDEKIPPVDYTVDNIPKLEEVLTAHPDRTFYVFTPPRSGLFLNRHADEYHRALLALSTLLAYPNLRLFDFTQMRSVTMDISRYKDVGHYDAAANSAMVTAFAENRYRIVPENIDDALAQVLTYQRTTLADLGITDQDIAIFCAASAQAENKGHSKQSKQ
ncbi:hypothetical protein [Halodesulfovibrio spirochaetisodalis]|nr:hypothetical protein [Halodesulfovibrio spirochaetisodalis]